MAQPSYTTDLTDVVADREHDSNWYELTGYTGGGADTDETDYFIQGTGCVSQAISGKTGLSVGLEYRDPGGDITSFTDNTDVFLFWHVVLAGNAMDTFDNGGMQIAIGSSTGNVNYWYVGGKDFGRNPVGGWHNVAVDPQQTADDTDGTPTASNYQIYGSRPNMVASVSKGNMHAMDAIRWGRAEIINQNGDATNGYGTFTEMGRANDANDVSFTADTTNADATLTNIAAAEVEALYPGAPLSGTGIPASTEVKYIVSTTSVEMTNNATATGTGVTITSQPYNVWGLFQKEGVGYLWKGLMSFGQSGTACDFRDSNAQITVDSTPKTYAAFNKIEVNNASSRVDWTNISITALDASQQSPGSFEMIDDATVNFTNCTFTDMTTFIFDSNATVTDTTFRRCGQVTQAAGTFNGCRFEESDAATSILSDNPSALDGCTFVSDGSNHAIEINTAGTYNLTNHTFTSYATTDGSTGNEVIYNNSGGSVTLNTSGNTGTISVRNGASATTTIIESVDIDVHVEDASGTAVSDAQVYVQKSAAGKEWNYTSASGNALNDTDFVVTGAVDLDIPASGWLQVWDKSDNTKQNYRYASWTTATDTTFTLNTAVTGSATSTDGTDPDTKLISTSTNFLTADIEEGDTIYNTTDLSWAVVDEIVDADNITTSQLQGGTDNNWQSGDGFSLHKLAKAYTATDDLVNLPLENGQTDGSGDFAGTYNWGAIGTPLPVTIRVRSNNGATKYQPFKTSGTIGSGGLSTTAVLTEDEVAT